MQIVRDMGEYNNDNKERTITIINLDTGTSKEHQKNMKGQETLIKEIQETI